MLDGYARITTDDRSVEAPLAVLTAAAVTVVCDVASGATTDRAQWRHGHGQLHATIETFVQVQEEQCLVGTFMHP
jgi:hypothetical protein